MPNLEVLNAHPAPVTMPMHHDFFKVALRSFDFEGSPEVLGQYIAFVADGICFGVCAIDNDRPTMVLAHIAPDLVESLLGPGFEEERGAWLDRKPFTTLQMHAMFIELALRVQETLGKSVKVRILKVT